MARHLNNNVNGGRIYTNNGVAGFKTRHKWTNVFNTQKHTRYQQTLYNLNTPAFYFVFSSLLSIWKFQTTTKQLHKTNGQKWNEMEMLLHFRFQSLCDTERERENSSFNCVNGINEFKSYAECAKFRLENAFHWPYSGWFRNVYVFFFLFVSMKTKTMGFSAKFDSI